MKVAHLELLIKWFCSLENHIYLKEDQKRIILGGSLILIRHTMMQSICFPSQSFLVEDF